MNAHRSKLRPYHRRTCRGVFDSVGIQTHEILISVSTGSIIALFEGTAEQVAEITMIVMASGALREFAAEEVISTETMAAVMKSASTKAEKYAAPHKNKRTYSFLSVEKNLP